MKKLLVILALCLMSPAVILDAQNKEKIAQERGISKFSGIEVSDGIRVKVKRGTSAKLSVLSTTDVVESVKTDVIAGILVVKYDNHLDVSKSKKKKDIVVEVTMETLSSIKVSMYGAVECSDAMGANTETLTIDASTNAKVSVNTKAKYVKVDSNSNAEVCVKGTTEYAYFSASKGKILAKGLKAVGANVTAAAESYVSVAPVTELKVSSMGKSKVEYKGDPRVTQTSSAGGLVIKK